VGDRPFYAKDEGAICGEPKAGGGRCVRAPDRGYNPLGFCREHLEAYRAHLPVTDPIGEPPTWVLDPGGHHAP
jgi:hypothetical protein